MTTPAVEKKEVTVTVLSSTKDIIDRALYLHKLQTGQSLNIAPNSFIHSLIEALAEHIEQKINIIVSKT